MSEIKNVNVKGKTIISQKWVMNFAFGEVMETENEYIIYSDKEITIFDKNTGKNIFEYEIKDKESFSHRIVVKPDFFYILNNDKVVLYTLQGKKFSEEIFDDFYLLENDNDLKFIIVEKNGKEGVYSFEGTKIVPCEYFGIDFLKSTIMAYTDEKLKDYYLYSYSGNLVFVD